jgi:aquaporin Z
MEAAGLGFFMLSACLFAILLMHPESPVVQSISSSEMRRVLMGLAMGGTAMALIYSPWGRRSGAHLNPAVTLTFARLGRVTPSDAAFYAAFQLAGGLAGVCLAVLVAGDALRDSAVNFVVTVPGQAGTLSALAAEFGMSFLMMTLVLCVSNSRMTRWTGVCSGVAVALFISTVGPVSGMSMNPARTLASAIPARTWTGLWVYLVAPPLAMLTAAEIDRRLRGAAGVGCPKLDRLNQQRCIFCNSPTGHA